MPWNQSSLQRIAKDLAADRSALIDAFETVVLHKKPAAFKPPSFAPEDSTASYPIDESAASYPAAEPPLAIDESTASTASYPTEPLPPSVFENLAPYPAEPPLVIDESAKEPDFEQPTPQEPQEDVPSPTLTPTPQEPTAPPLDSDSDEDRASPTLTPQEPTAPPRDSPTPQEPPRDQEEALLRLFPMHIETREMHLLQAQQHLNQVLGEIDRRVALLNRRVAKRTVSMV